MPQAELKVYRFLEAELSRSLEQKFMRDLFCYLVFRGWYAGPLPNFF